MPALCQTSADPYPPEPGEVLRAIYKKAGDGTANYGIGDGIWVSYWCGHMYWAGGRRYFTGFAYATGTQGQSQDRYSAPGDRVTLSQATYVLAPAGSVAIWEFVCAQRNIGRFGGRDRGDEIDDRSPFQSHATPAGDYLLAVPAWRLVSGVRMYATQILRLRLPGPLWEHLGGVATGEDGTAACAQVSGQGASECEISQGELTFRHRSGEDMPSIVVAFKTKTVDAAGKAGKLNGFDNREYFFDRAAKKYG